MRCALRVRLPQLTPVPGVDADKRVRQIELLPAAAEERPRQLDDGSATGADVVVKTDGRPMQTSSALEEPRRK